MYTIIYSIIYNTYKKKNIILINNQYNFNPILQKLFSNYKLQFLVDDFTIAKTLYEANLKIKLTEMGNQEVSYNY